jgi:hypothetical protein
MAESQAVVLLLKPLLLEEPFQLVKRAQKWNHRAYLAYRKRRKEGG